MMTTKNNTPKPINTKILERQSKVNLVSGGIAGLISISCTHPLERVKLMRIWGVDAIVNQSIPRSLVTLVRSQGPFALLRGNSASVVREIPMASLMFFFYEKFKAMSMKYKQPNDPDLPYRVVSGMWAGIISNTVIYFLDPVKATMASDFDGKAGNMFNILARRYRKSGLIGYTKGWSAAMCSITPFIGKYFINFHYFYDNFSTIGMNMTLFDYLKFYFGTDPESSYFSILNLFLGSVSAVTTMCTIFPFENVRRRIQTSGQTTYAGNYDGIKDWWIKVYKRYGIWGFYHGLLPAWCKVIAYYGLMFMINEKARAFFNKHQVFE